LLFIINYFIFSLLFGIDAFEHLAHFVALVLDVLEFTLAL